MALNGIKIPKMMVDLLFGGVCVARLLPNLLNGLSEQEILSRYCFGSESIECITNLLFECRTRLAANEK